MEAPTNVAPERWPRPPLEGWTADDLDRLPNLPAHAELIDGSLVFESPQPKFRMQASRLLERELVRMAPPETEIVRGMTVPGIHDEQLKVTVPFQIEVDLTALHRRGQPG